MENLHLTINWDALNSLLLLSKVNKRLLHIPLLFHLLWNFPHKPIFFLESTLSLLIGKSIKSLMFALTYPINKANIYSCKIKGTIDIISMVTISYFNFAFLLAHLWYIRMPFSLLESQYSLNLRSFKMAGSSSSFELKPILSEHIEQSLEFLRQNFFPYEPCAVNIDLCPLGYR